MTLESEIVTIDAVSILQMEVFEGFPLWYIGLFVFIFVFIMFFIMLIAWIFHAEQVVENRVHHAPSSHEVVVELQRELLRSMQSTSKQNWLMIWLTIIFITVSVLGGAFILNFLQNVGNYGATWISQIIEYLKPFFTK
jgi:hypothetical protein